MQERETEEMIFQNDSPSTSYENESPSTSHLNSGLTDEVTKVHFKNLQEAPGNKTVRRMNKSHVQELIGSFRSNGKQEKLLACELTSGKIEDLGQEGKATCQVIGGNHTRAALTHLISIGLWSSEFINCRVYSPMSDTQALRVGMEHNLIDQQSLEMSFIEKTEVLRKLKKAKGRRWSKDAQTVFGFKTLSETRNKLRTMAALSDVDDEMWQRISLLCHKSNRPIRQTAFTKYVSLPAEVQQQLLQVWEDSGYKMYTEEMRKKGGSQQTKQTLSETRNKLRTMAALSDVDDEMWQRISLLCHKSNRPIRQTAFTKYVSLPAEVQQQLLQVWEDSGYKMYTEEMRKKGGSQQTKQDNRCTESNEDTSNIQSSKEDMSNIQSSNEDVSNVESPNEDISNVQSSNEDEENLERVKEKLQQMEVVMVQKDKEIQHLQQETNQKDREIQRLRQEIEKMKQETEQKSQVPCQTCENRKRKADVLVEENNKENDHKVDDLVWAYYKPLSQFYPAKIVAHNGQMYQVKYLEDGIRKKYVNTI